MRVLQEARSLLKASTEIVSFSGAGLSAESGLATFRDADGIWAKYDPAVYASVDGFERDPLGVSEWYALRRRSFAQANPNPAHLALANRRMRHVTQNIDTLLERAGAEDVIHLHGVIDRDRCHGGCGHRESVDPDNPPSLRACPRCGSAMRPDVVWFGEFLPDIEWSIAIEAISGAEVLLVIGTSAEVWPAAGLIHSASDAGIPIIVVNAEPGTAPRIATYELVGLAGELVPALLRED